MQQLSIPMPAQPRNRRYERASTWEIVMFLRRAQYTVRRQGRLHSVNGKRLTTYELKRLAGWVRGMAA